MKVAKFEPIEEMVAPFFIALGSCILFFGLACLFSWWKPFINYHFGCVTILHYIAGIFLGLSIISAAVAVFCVPFLVQTHLMFFGFWILSIYLLSLVHVGLHPMNNCENPKGKLAFEYVVKDNILKLSELLKTSPEVISELSYNENTLLHQAVYYKRKGIIAILLTANLSVNQTNSSGYSSYAIACQSKRPDIINLLSAYRRVKHVTLPEKKESEEEKKDETG